MYHFSHQSEICLGLCEDGLMYKEYHDWHELYNFKTVILLEAEYEIATKKVPKKHQSKRATFGYFAVLEGLDDVEAPVEYDEVKYKRLIPLEDKVDRVLARSFPEGYEPNVRAFLRRLMLELLTQQKPGLPAGTYDICRDGDVVEITGTDVWGYPLSATSDETGVHIRFHREPVYQNPRGFSFYDVASERLFQLRGDQSRLDLCTTNYHSEITGRAAEALVATCKGSWCSDAWHLY